VNYHLICKLMKHICKLFGFTVKRPRLSFFAKGPVDSNLTELGDSVPDRIGLGNSNLLVEFY
jgi:hypothetical protein